jgi:hypothetical protein
LAVVQAELFDGIHLPDLMGSLRPWGRGGRLASGRGRRLLGALHPALQRSRAGKSRELGMQMAQLNKQVGSAPGGMFLVQEQGLLHRSRRRGGVGLPVSGFQSSVAVLAELVAELANRARCQSESAGNDGGVGAASEESEDALTQRLGERGRHGGSLEARRNGEVPVRKH